MEKFMKSLRLALIVVLLISTHAFAYYIESFNSSIRILPNSDFWVDEEIIVNFGNEQRHGIYRDIPYKYDLPMRKYRVRIAVDRVVDEAGKEYQTKISKRGDYLNIRIGSPNFKVTGKQVYHLRYRVENAILFFNDHDELYWNVTGTEWECEIKAASASVHLPESVDEKDIRTTCFTGAYGSESRNCKAQFVDDRGFFIATKSLGTYENLSIGLAFPKGIVEKPGFARWLRWYFVDMWPFLLLILCIVWLLSTWLARGRDPIKMSIAPRYEPPSDLSPAEAGTVIDERVDIRDMTSTIVDLAVRGYLKIVEIEKKKIIFFKKADYILVRLKDSDDELKPFESKMLDGLFTRGSIESADKSQLELICPDCKGREAIATSSLKEKFYIELPKIRDSIYKRLVKEKYFPSCPEEIRQKYTTFGVIILIAGFVLAMVASNWAFAASLMPAGIITLLAAKKMPRKTKKGTIAAVNVAGFEEFIRRVEKDRIERMAIEDPTIFERLLPYAMALGVADQWAEAFEGIFKEAPRWFVGPSGQRFSPNVFVYNLGSAVQSTGSAMSARPRSSGASGGNSSFGGGGFSGGGFGGGGGGAW